MVWTQLFLPHRQCAGQKCCRWLPVFLSQVKGSQIAQRQRHVHMVGPEEPLLDRERAGQQTLGIGILPMFPMQDPKVVEHCGDVQMVLSVHLLINLQRRSAEMMLQAIGRRPNITGLGLAAAGVEVADGRLTVGPDMRTSQPHIFAVGDVNDLTPIVHLAVQQGEVAAFNATHPGEPPRVIDHRLDAEAVFTEPQVAVAGLSERQCRAQALPYLTASYPFADHGKAMCMGAAHGFVKLVCRPDSGALLGAQIVGPQAAELIHELLAVMYFGGTAQDLLRIPHYHPTLAEIVTYPAESIVEQMHR